MKQVLLKLFSQENSSIELIYNITQAPIGERFLKALQESLQLPCHKRFHNFPGSLEDEEWISTEIQKILLAVNEYKPGTTKLRVKDKLSQDDLNELHHFFEVYHGSINSISPFFNAAPPHIQSGLGRINLLIHQYEDYLLNQSYIEKGEAPLAKIFLNFEDRKRFPLEEQDYQEFTLKVDFGGWYLDYCEVGKSIWDLYIDQDEHIGDENIRPLRYYSADSFLLFSPGNSDKRVQQYQSEFSHWWDQNKEYLSALGFQKNDSKNAIGSIKLAQLDLGSKDLLGRSEQEVVELIGKHQKSCQIEVI